jgi:DNA-binding response OmpR family regulator
MKIIVVEDDATIGSLLLRGLSAEGLAVDWLTSIRTARPPLLAGTHDAAILDLGLPDGDGLDLCRELRAAGSEIPILMLTARTSIDDKLDGFRCGADDYLAKPFSFAELLARLNAMLRRQAPLRAMRLAVGDLRIDAISHVARIGERPLDLTRREFALLHVLARHQGRPVSRAQLLDAAWGEGVEVTDNSVDVYIGYLRRRLSAHASAPELVTVRGIGFMLRTAP